MHPVRPVFTPLRGVTLALVLAATVAASGTTEGGFVASLSSGQQIAAGIVKLTPAERIALDQLVAGDQVETRLAEGRVLSGTLADRHTAAEIKAAGLDRLTADELRKLDDLIATTPVATPPPRQRPRLKDDSVIYTHAKPEVHGSVSFTYGVGSGGRSFRGGEFWVNYTIPEYGLSLSVGMSRYSGDGMFGYASGPYRSLYLRPGAAPFRGFNDYLPVDEFDLGPVLSLPAGTLQNLNDPDHRHD